MDRSRPIQSGEIAPEFSLEAAGGGPVDPVRQARRAAGNTLIVFFKDDCPACRYALPFLGRIHEALGDRGVGIYGISQDDRDRSLAFAAETGIRFPVLLDHENYEVSRLYGLVAVPALVMLDGSGKVVRASAGFSRAETERIASELASSVNAPAPGVWNDGEEIIEAKPG